MEGQCGLQISGQGRANRERFLRRRACHKDGESVFGDKVVLKKCKEETGTVSEHFLKEQTYFFLKHYHIIINSLMKFDMLVFSSFFRFYNQY